MRLCHQCGASSKDDDRFCASCGALLLKESGASTDPLVGRTIGGSYVLQEIVGVGGMGRVYRAEQSTLGRTVAIKVIHPHLLGDDQTVARFYTEARASSRLNHPNSVSIIDFGRTDDGILYLAMEFLAGKDLAVIMHEEGPLPFKRTCDILIEVLSALEEAHVNDIVHRDLKPENIILRRMGSGQDLVKVVDFGLATIVGTNSTSITRPGLVCGTPDYMAPEQGRGEQVDGRGDLYSLGVVLFELLADQLPFDDETPTKVVLRHINDPVPDPRTVAPHRGIPDTLADICMRALQKDRDDRFQNARQMADAIRAARASLDIKTPAVVECSSCGAENPSQMRFCGSCGSRLATPTPVRRPTGPAPMRSSFYPLSDDERPLVGRHRALETLAAGSEGPARSLAILGEAGVGKTRLLQEVAKLYAEQGMIVVGASPHPLAAPIPYLAARQLFTGLLNISDAELESFQNDASTFRDPLVRAGIAELATPHGLPGSSMRSRAPAVAAALRDAVRVALTREKATRVALLVDDLDECDSLSHEVLRSLVTDPAAPLTVVFSSHVPLKASEVVELHGLTLPEAEAFLAKNAPSHDDLDETVRRYLPLYLEQIERFGARSPQEEGLPTRLADAVSQRFDGLDVGARHLLQAISVFGGRAGLEELREVLDDNALRAGDELTKKGFAYFQGGGLEICHPFIARLVEAFIPAEARKDLHRQVQGIMQSRDTPLEVIAEHAYRSGEPMRTLMTLERMGDAARARGDHATAVLAFRRSLELARREMLESGDSVMDTAIVTFSRKLAWALALAGDVARADGVVREVLELTGRSSLARARMYVVLGRISRLRDKHRDAMRFFGQALELAAGEDGPTELELQLAMGEMRLADDDPAGAANAFRRALELAKEGTPDQIRAQFQLAEAVLRIGDTAQTQKETERAMGLATGAGAHDLLAHAHGLIGLLAQRQGYPEHAQERFENAAAFAAAAGDVPAMERWRDQLQSH